MHVQQNLHNCHHRTLISVFLHIFSAGVEAKIIFRTQIFEIFRDEGCMCYSMLLDNKGDSWDGSQGKVGTVLLSAKSIWECSC